MASLAVAYAEAAGICLSRHHASPATITLHHGRSLWPWTIVWPAPTERELRAWANDTDRVEAGAYSLALTAVEVSLGLVAISRAETSTGADFYLATPSEDFETAFDSRCPVSISGT